MQLTGASSQTYKLTRAADKTKISTEIYCAQARKTFALLTVQD